MLWQFGKKNVADCSLDFARRDGKLLGVLAERLRPFVIDNVAYMHQALTTSKHILIAGANAPNILGGMVRGSQPEQLTENSCSIQHGPRTRSYYADPRCTDTVVLYPPDAT